MPMPCAFDTQLDGRLCSACWRELSRRAHLASCRKELQQAACGQPSAAFRNAELEGASHGGRAGDEQRRGRHLRTQDAPHICVVHARQHAGEPIRTRHEHAQLQYRGRRCESSRCASRVGGRALAISAPGRDRIISIARIFTDVSSKSLRRPASFIQTCAAAPCISRERAAAGSNAATHRAKETVERKYGYGLRGGSDRDGDAKRRPKPKNLLEGGGDDHPARQVHWHARHPGNEEQKALHGERQYLICAAARPYHRTVPVAT